MAFFALCASIFVMFLQPVYIWPKLDPLQPLKNSAIIAMVAYLFAGRKSGKPFLPQKVNSFFLLFAAMQVVSSSKLSLMGGWETFNLWFRIGIVYFLIVKSATDEKRLKCVILAVIAGIFYLAYFSYSRFIINYIPGTRAGGFGWYENPNDLAIILISVVPLTLLLANSARTAVVKYSFALITAFFAFDILFTGSRGGLLGLAAVGALSLLVSAKMPTIVRTALICLFGAVATVGMTNVLSRGVSGLRGDDSAEDRITQWKAGFRMLMDNPLFGVGRDEFASRVGEYGGVRGLAPHNTIVQVFGETGIIGGVFFTLFCFYPLWFNRELSRNPRYSRASSSVRFYRFVSIALGGFWVCAFFSNRYQFYILYVLVALLVAVKTNVMEADGAIDIQGKI
jgi:O-antigen ligase